MIISEKQVHELMMVAHIYLRLLEDIARQSLKGMKRVLDLMEKMLQSENADKVCVASAFFQILKHHMEEGDLSPQNLTLATLLRGDGKDLL